MEFEPLGRRGGCRRGETLLEAAQRNGVQLVSVCGGMGSCGSCRVRVLEGDVSPPTQSEAEHLTPSDLATGWRLACQAKCLGPVRVFIPPETLAHNYRLQLEGLEAPWDLSPQVKGEEMSLSPPNLSDPRADADRLLDRLQGDGTPCKAVDLWALRSLPVVLRENAFKVKVALRDGEVIGVHPPGTPFLGVAVDLGTTKIALYLVDLEGGRTLVAKGIPNPQISFGEDIITRLHKAIRDPEVAKEMQRVVVLALNDEIRGLCDQVGALPGQVMEMVLVGNTAMHHLFLGLPVGQLALSPFVPAVSTALEVKARDLGLRLGEGAYVHLLPNIAGFVGADHVAALLATGVWREEGPVLLLDIGTNTEISLVKGGRIFTASTPSGPAFEGGHIKHGMRAASGAIEKVRIKGEEVWYRTIDDEPPVGICGSGIIDTVAQLLMAGILDERGRLLDVHPRVREGEGGKEFVLVEGRGGRDIVMTQKDIRELQLAKASIRAGILGLLEEAKVEEWELKRVYIAGAFGTYIDVQSAVTIGMLPPLPLDRFIQVGNAAGVGARLALLSRERRREAEEITRRVHYVELASSARFQRLLLEGSYFGKYTIKEGRRYVHGD